MDMQWLPRPLHRLRRSPSPASQRRITGGATSDPPPRSGGGGPRAAGGGGRVSRDVYGMEA